jgi:predicted nucleic acid-binding protein
MSRPSRIFLDTNVLIYAADSADTDKQLRAQTVVKKVRTDGSGVISTQVMQEFFAVCVKKLGLTPLDARELTLTLNDFEVVSLTSAIVEQAMDVTILHQLSFWDALILSAAREARCGKLLTEDMQPGRTLTGVRIESPF